MAKTSKKKKTKKGKTTRKTSKKTDGKKETKVKYESTKEIKVEKALIDNFVALQKVMVNLSAKFDNLSSEISKLLQLFEISAKNLAKKDLEKDKDNKDTKKIIEKLGKIEEQAGLIGRGLALIHEIGSESPEEIPEEPEIERSQPKQQPSQFPPQRPKPMARMPIQPRRPQPTPKQPHQQQGKAETSRKEISDQGMQGYQKSISSRISKENT